MRWLIYLLVSLVVCVACFFTARIWVGSIDLIISGFKKLFGFNKKNNTEKWYTLEDIRDKNKKDKTDKYS